MEILSISPDQTKELAGRIAKDIKPGSTILLFGDLGAGKTTFVRGFVEGLGFEARVQSPTFVLIRSYVPKNEYFKNGQGVTKVNHLDLYRLADPAEFESLDIKGALEEAGTVNIIEWPKIIEEKIKDPIKVYIETVGTFERKINVQGLY